MREVTFIHRSVNVTEQQKSNNILLVTSTIQ